jgi:hypothetical protein
LRYNLYEKQHCVHATMVPVEISLGSHVHLPA